VSVMLFWKKRWASLSILYGFLLSGLVVQIIKRTVNSPRPKSFFLTGEYNNFIDGVQLYTNGSFPSGHTATAFAVATVAVLFIKNQRFHLPILLAAILVGYSRVYLGQHFVGDVLAGAVLGILCAFPAIFLGRKTMKWTKK
jgi:membrane-associated phospholipid phosphatase